MPGANVVLVLAVALALYAAGTYVVSRRVEGRRRATDRLVTVTVSAAFVAALVPLVSLIWTAVSRGTGRFDLALFTETMRNVIGEGGGIQHAIWGTLIITAIATLISVPLGLFVAIYLVEYGRGRLARWITLLVDVMTGIPSIVAGLFAVGLFTTIFDPGYRSGLAGAVALSVLMVPVVVRASEEMLRLVPMRLREAAYGLGVPTWRTIVKVVLPTALPGIVTGVILAIARVIGETAPLLLAAGITNSTNLNPFDGRMASLPLFVFYSYLTPGRAPGTLLRPGLGRRPRPDDPHRRAVRARAPGRTRADPERHEMSSSDHQASVTTDRTEPAPVEPDQAPNPDLARVAAQTDSVDRTGDDHNRIDVTDLSLYYGDFKAVEGVTMTIDPRSVTALIGPSGCGKSTFLRSLNRMHEVVPGARAEGHVVLNGQDLYAKDVDPVLVRRKVGMVFQQPNPFPTMSIRDNVLAGLKLNARKVPDADEHRRAVAAGREPLGGGQGPARQARVGPVRRPAAAPVHRSGDRRGPRRAADGRAVLGAGPDLHAGDRGPHPPAQGDLHDRDRDPQHAAGRPRQRSHGVLQHRGDRQARASWSRWTAPRSSSPSPPRRPPSTTSPAASADRRSPLGHPRVSFSMPGGG